jgi:hypothetical protein
MDLTDTLWPFCNVAGQKNFVPQIFGCAEAHL